MDFKDATDRLSATVTQEDIATAAGVSVSTIRQARMAPGSEGYRSPPPGWEAAVAKLARARAAQLLKLSEDLLGLSAGLEERRDLAFKVFNFTARLMYEIHSEYWDVTAAEAPDPMETVRMIAEGKEALGDPGRMMAKFPRGAHVVAAAANRLVAQDKELAGLVLEAASDVMRRISRHLPESDA